MNPQITFILTSSFGALCQEILYWFELRNKLKDKQISNLMRSKFYWIITLLTILISGIGTWILFYDQIPDKKSIQFILGAAFPAIFKKLVQTYKETLPVVENASKSVRNPDSDKSPGRMMKLYFLSTYRNR